ncbi:MAG: cyclophilin-like fold protein, partial [Nocardioides sp.]
MPAVLTALVALLGAGCGGAGETRDNPGDGARDATAQSAPTRPPSREVGGGEAGEPADRKENRMDIHITISDQTFGATLDDSPAARDLLAQLPATVE